MLYYYCTTFFNVAGEDRTRHNACARDVTMYCQLPFQNEYN